MSDPCREWPELARTSRDAKDRAERMRDIIVKYTQCHPYILEEIKTYPEEAAFRAEEMLRSANVYGLEIPNGGFEDAIEKTGQQMRALAAKYEKPVAKSPRKKVDRKADPVVMWSGELVYETQDLRLRGAGVDFAFVRTYKHQAGYHGPLGHGWDHVYNAWLRVSHDEAVLSMGDLSTRSYVRHPRFGDPGFDYWMPPDGTDAVLLERGGDFVVRRPDGTELTFEVDPFTQSFLFRLAKIEDRHGNALRLEHDARGVIRITVNGPDRFVLFDYDDSGRLITLSDHGGRRWRYDYDDFGDLATVIAPTGDQVLYEYSSPWAPVNRQHRLTRVTDPKRRIHLEVAYGEGPGTLEDDRVVRQREAGGEYLFAYEDLLAEIGSASDGPEVAVRATTMIGRGGHEQRHLYNDAGNLLAMEEVAVIGGRARRLRADYRYDADGSLVSSRTPEGVVTQYLYGREAFLRRFGVADASLPEALDRLDLQTRQGFGRLLATVRRAHPPSAGFPDLYAVHPDDIVQKTAYEPEFGQVVSRSDARFTRTVDPEGVEDAQYDATLTRFSYDGPTRLLAEIRHPTPHDPDGAVAAPVVERFSQYDPRGRLLRHEMPSGLVKETRRFVVGDGSREGLVREVVLDPSGIGVTTRYELDAWGRVTATIRPKGVASADGRFIERFELDALDRTTRTIASAPFDFETRNTFDSAGMLVREERDATDFDGSPIPGGPSVRTWEYDDDLRVRAESQGGVDARARAVTRHRYDAFGALAISFHPNGNRTRFRYDARGLPTAQIHGYGTKDSARRSADHDGDGRVFRSRDARGNATISTFDALGRVIATEDPLGHVVRHTYSKTDQPLVERVFERRASGHVLVARSERRYDELDRLVEEVTNRFDEPLAATDLETDFVASPGPGEAVVWHTFYDSGGRVVRRREVNRGIEVRFEHDPLGRLAREVDAVGSRTEYRYDLHGNPVRVDRFEGGRVLSREVTYDELDRVTSRTDPLGNVVRFHYDSADRLVRTVDALGNVRDARHDLRGHLREDIRRRTSTGLGPGSPLDAVVTRYEHDANGNLVASIDPLGRRTRFEYDALDRRIARVDVAGRRTELGYDRDGNVVRLTSPSGRALVRTIDARGRVVRVEAAGVAAEGPRQERFEYDALGRTTLVENDNLRVTIRRDSLGQALEERMTWLVGGGVSAQPLVVRRAFDTAGRMVELVYPDQRRVEYVRDALGSITSVRNVASGSAYPGTPGLAEPRPIVSQVETSGRRRTGLVFGNGAHVRWRHDGVGRVVEIAHAGPTGSLLTLQYLCDAVSNVRWSNELLGANRSGRLCRYDSLRQLVRDEPRDDLPVLGLDFDPAPFGLPQAVLPTPLPDRQSSIDAVLGRLELASDDDDFVYDVAGNRQAARRATGVETYEVNELDEYVDVGGLGVAHDLDGNMVRSGSRVFDYDAWGRLISVTEPGRDTLRFFHDARGRRVAQSQGSHTLALVYDDERLIEERAGDTLLAQWVNDDGLDHPLHLACAGEELYYHADLQGSIRMLSGVGGSVRARYAYSPFGESRGHSDDPYNPLRYTGRRLDTAIESYDFRARQYDPRVGRFLQRDPVESSDGPFAYAGNNPLAFNDPRGTTRKEAVQGDPSQNAPAPAADTDSAPAQSAATPPAEPPKPPSPPVNVVLYGRMSEDQVEVIRMQLNAYDPPIRQLEAKDQELANQTRQLKTKIFEAERWTWPNWGTAATFVDLGEKLIGCYAGPWWCAAEVGSGVAAATIDDNAGRVIGYGAAIIKGKGDLALEAGADAGAWGFKRWHKQSEARKKSKGAKLREEMKNVELEREVIRGHIELMEQQKRILLQALIDDANKTLTVQQYPDGSIGL